jgi:hydrogenase maturation factor
MKLKLGKLPPELLKELLDTLPPADASVIVGGAVGEDAAVIDAGGEDLIVAKTDPITFAGADAGRYLLAVNGNDLATMGAEPRWLLVTALLPEGIEEEQVRSLFADLTAACREYEVSLVGGHTEVTVGLDRPILVGCLLGTVRRAGVVRTAGAKVGDAILLTKGVAIEGTAILAREHSDLLQARGVSRDVIERAANWLVDPGLSVRPASRALMNAVQVQSMHDPTEGGIVTALHELSEAAGVGIRVQRDEIAVFPETRAVCAALRLDSLGLLASGALLATVPGDEATAALAALREAGIPAALIGEIVPPEDGRRITSGGASELLPVFARDELAQFLDSL